MQKSFLRDIPTIMQNIQDNQLIHISPISFGGASLSGEGGGYGFGPISEQDSLALVREALDLGITLFDSAPIYGFGLSEERLGRALKGVREKVLLLSKSGVTWHPNKRVNMTNDPKITQLMLEESLRRLQTDYLDIYMIHWPDLRVDIRRPMEVLVKAQEAGKIRFLGLCNTTLEDLRLAQEIARIEVVQSEWNFFQRTLAPELIEAIKKEKMAFMSWGTLDKGILTGSVTPQRKYDPLDARSWAPWWKKVDRTFKFQVMEKLIPYLKERGYTPLELALGFNLLAPRSQEFVTTALCGLRNRDQLREVVAALDHLPGPELIESCDQFLNLGSNSNLNSNSDSSSNSDSNSDLDLELGKER